MMCVLCDAEANVFFESSRARYYQCGHCSAVFLDPKCYVSKEQEKERYQKHNNDVKDSGYQKFVQPIVSAVKEKFGKEHEGLDFGAGPGPVVAKLLRDEGYSIELYDPFFWNDPQKLQRKYDFIVCCEVMEHFHFPLKEFRLLKSLLKPQGVLFCMTNVYSQEIDFEKWYYKNDQTHVLFYHQNSLEWIKSRLGFSSLIQKGRLVQFLV